MKKSIALAAVALGYTWSVFAQPSFLPTDDHSRLTQVTKKANNLDVDFSGRWVGRCEGDAVNSEFIIQQSPNSLTMAFGNEKIRFMLNGVSSNERFNMDIMSQEKYVADWDSQSQDLRLKMVRMGHGNGGFELTLSQLTLHLTNNQLYIQNTHHALFNGTEELQSGKTNCLYEKNNGHFS